MYKYLFGPVLSRRLGVSLGVDLVPKKVCSLDCVYCEAGKTTRLTLERKEYVRFEKIKEELKHYFNNNPAPDYITFSGAGEPTLNSAMGEVIDFIKKEKNDIPIAVLTNGNLFYQPEIRNMLHKANLVLPSLDAVSEEVFKKINRPAENLTAAMCIEGLEKFAKEFKGKIWLEIFILPDYNNSPEELQALYEVAKRIDPEIVQLNTLDRPGTETDIYPATVEQLQKIKNDWAWDKVQIVAAAAKHKKQQTYRKDIEAAILGTIARRPCTLNDLSKMLNIEQEKLIKEINKISEAGKISVERQERGLFYKLARR